jgi:putative transposase
VLTDGQGIPIAVVVAGANRHDMKLLAATLAAVVIERPEPTEEAPQHLCADKGYDYAECREEAARQEYIAHIRSRGEEHQAKQSIPGYRARRWVVEVCHSWLNRFRKILVRFEKQLATHLALLQLACAYIVLKRAEVFR